MAIQELDNLCMGCMSINKAGSVCSKCGFDNSAQQSSLVLPYRTILNKKFLIGKVLGKGGFGITYLAWDLVLQTAVAIKEYLPATLATRDNNRPIVVAHSDENRLEFEYGLKQFLQEARTLAQFRHANVVRVREFFPANKTAYLVMDYYEGVSLQQFLQFKNQKLTEEEALKIMLPVLGGLAQVHQKGFLHRDIKPDNIYLVDKEHPVLLDFGAARSAISQKSVSMSVVLTPGFAPFEQYLSRSNFTPATDIYSVAATIYYMVSGIKPNEATARLQNDPIIHLANLEPDLGQQFSNSIMKALAVYPENRPQSIKEFEEQLIEQPAQTQTFKKPVYKPGYINNPTAAPESKAVKLDLAPMEKASPQEKKYETYFCPHCKTKNVLREGRLLADAKCIKCRKTPGEKVKKPFSLATLFKISLLLPLLLLVYEFTIHNITNDSFVKNLEIPTDIRSKDEQQVMANASRPSSDVPAKAPDLQTLPAPIQVPESRLTMEAFPRLARPIPDQGLPRLAPLFAIKACEGKVLHEDCVAQTPRRKLAGICEEVRGTMACIPGFPN